MSKQPKEPPMPDDITARLENGTWYVEGDWLKWLMSGINFDDRESFMYFEKMLREKGIIRISIANSESATVIPSACMISSLILWTDALSPLP